MDQPEYRFKIDAYTPETFPMARLAAYMGDLAVLLGEQEHVHFVRLEPGSTVLVQRIDRESAPRVRDRIRALRPSEGQGAGDALSAFKTINLRLAEDNATGQLCGDGGAQIIRFPGREQPQPLIFGAFRQPGRLDGVLIRLGGMGETVPVHLEDECAVHQSAVFRIAVVRIQDLPLLPESSQLAPLDAAEDTPNPVGGAGALRNPTLSGSMNGCRG